MKSRFSSRNTVEGFAFPDFIKTESLSSRRHNHDDFSGHRSLRGFLLPISLFALTVLLVVKLFSVEVFQGNYYRALSDNNRIRTTIVHAPRGIIFDRNGVSLVFNIPGFRVATKDAITLLSRDEAMGRIASGEKDLEIDSLRQYPYTDAFAHVLGYIGQITKEELQSPQMLAYNIDDVVGKTGIEEAYESTLRGIDGKQLVEVDATGKKERTLGQEDPIAGKNITVTLDIGMQKAAFSAMKDVKKGAVVVQTPKGEMLALLAKPSFDPNLFTLGKTYATASESAYQDILSMLSDSENQPLLNRAISGVYPPGSTFKLVTAAAGLESNTINDQFTIVDTGILHVGAFSFGNWYFLQYGRTEGELNVVKAIKRSNDIFFYKLAQLVGVDRLSEMAKKFGIGRKLGIDLAGEASGLLPTQEWKEKTIGEPWYLGDTYHYGIGQGYLLTTPLQVNTWTQVIANGGVLYQPHLLQSSKFKVQSSKLLSEKNFSLIREGMIESCSTGGVAWPLFEFKVKNAKLKTDGKNFLEVPEASISGSMKDYRKVSIACKTGTAQHGGEQTLPHAWITLFAPAYDPQIIVTVLAESSGEGSNIAAPIAKKILEEWFGR